jgi:glycosyltransferase involved in cell wall biosynthesis
LYSLVEATTARSAGAPVLLHLHEILPSGRKGTLARAVAARVARETVAVSRASAASFTSHRTHPRVVFEGTTIPAEPVSLRRTPKPFVVGTVASISPRKGSDVFVEAAERLRGDSRNIKFHMVGPSRDPIDPGWGDRLLLRAREVGIEHTAYADVSSVLPRWDAFALPSRLDPFPLAMLEAMAAGLPVIGTRAGGIPEQVSEGCGLLVPPGDAAALSDAISALAEAPFSNRQAMGQAARRRVQDHFTVDRQVDGLDEAYRAVAGGPDPPT